MSGTDEFTKSRIALRYRLLGRQWHMASEALDFAETEEYFLPMLRAARTRYTRQEPVYENLKFVLLSQMKLLRAVSAADPG
jgi:hypothetical protein